MQTPPPSNRLRAASLRFERTGRTPRNVWAGFVAGCAPLAFVVATSITRHNPLPAFIAIAILGAAVGFGVFRPRFVYVRISDTSIHIRRGFYERSIATNVIAAIHLYQVAYPGLRGRPALIGIPATADGKPCARMVFIDWSDQEMAGLSLALGAPYVGSRRDAPVVGPSEVNEQWQGILGSIAPVYGYLALTLTYGSILTLVGVAAWAVIAGSPSINAPR
jgi:hypothetical protein